MNLHAIVGGKISLPNLHCGARELRPQPSTQPSDAASFFTPRCEEPHTCSWHKSRTERRTLDVLQLPNNPKCASQAPWQDLTGLPRAVRSNSRLFSYAARSRPRPSRGGRCASGFTRPPSATRSNHRVLDCVAAFFDVFNRVIAPDQVQGRDWSVQNAYAMDRSSSGA